MKSFIGGILAAFFVSAAAQATPITIDYSLPATSGSPSGTMSLVLSNTPSATYTNYNNLISAGSEATFGSDVFDLTSSDVTDLQFTSLSPDYALYVVELAYIHPEVGSAWLTMSSSFAYTSAAGVSSSGGFSNGTVVPVPEPMTLSLFGAGLVGIATLRRRRRTNQV